MCFNLMIFLIWPGKQVNAHVKSGNLGKHSQLKWEQGEFDQLEMIGNSFTTKPLARQHRFPKSSWESETEHGGAIHPAALGACGLSGEGRERASPPQEPSLLLLCRVGEFGAESLHLPLSRWPHHLAAGVGWDVLITTQHSLGASHIIRASEARKSPATLWKRGKPHHTWKTELQLT